MRKLSSIMIAAFILLSANSVFAGLCKKCAKGCVTCDIGKCKSCGAGTSSGAYKLCGRCSAKQKKCMRCLVSLGGKKKADAKKSEVKLLPDGKTFGQHNANDKLMDLAPVKEPGYSVITSKKMFAKLWNAWFAGKKKVPHVDFKKQFVIAAVAKMGNDPRIECRNNKGDVVVQVSRTEMAGQGFGFEFVIKNRKGVKTIDGKPLPKCGDFVKVGTVWSKRAVINPIRCENRAGQVSLITTLREFSRQWKLWFPNKAQPDVNFEDDFVMIALGFGGNIPSFGVDNKDGNMTVRVRTTRMMRPGYGMRMVVMARKGIKTINKVKLPSPSMVPLPKFVGTVKIDSSSNNKTIKVAINQELQITLNANPSTGFIWKDATKSKNVTLNGPVRFVPTQVPGGRRGPRPICGAGGKSVAKYFFEKEGTYTIKLVCVRPFGRNNKAGKTFTVKVKVTKAIDVKAQAKTTTLLVVVKDAKKLKKLKDQVAFAKKVDKVATANKCKIKIHKVLSAVGVVIVKVTATEDVLKKVEEALKKVDNVKVVERDQVIGINNPKQPQPRRRIQPPVCGGGAINPNMPLPRRMPVPQD